MPSKSMLSAVERYLAAQMQCENAANEISRCAAEEAAGLHKAQADLHRENAIAGDGAIRRVLAAVDRPDHPALDAAVKIAAPLHAQLAVVYVLEPLPAPNIETAASSTGLDEEARADAMAMIATLEREIPSNTPAITVLRHGPAASEILAAANDFNADLIVMGTHRRGPLARFFVGSVSQAVLRAARCPVMLVLDTETSIKTAPAQAVLQHV